MQRTTRGRAAFTLVELLVVIVIIGILGALITVAASSAIVKARETRIKVEVDMIGTAFQDYQAKFGSLPPSSNPQANTTQQAPLRLYMRRHLVQRFSRSRDNLDAAANQLVAQLSPAEAVVFWLGGFSTDPERPISGPGGPAETIENRRNALFKFDPLRVMPLLDNMGNQQVLNIAGIIIPRYIYLPQAQKEPYVYFDTSRAYALLPSYASVNTSGDAVTPYLKAVKDNMGQIVRADFVDSNSFQVASAGVDDNWGSPIDWTLMNSPPFFPMGPYVRRPDINRDYKGHADNLVNFSARNLENSIP